MKVDKIINIPSLFKQYVKEMIKKKYFHFVELNFRCLIEFCILEKFLRFYLSNLIYFKLCKTTNITYVIQGVP